MAAHLTPLAAALLHELPKRRICAILGERWVLYPRAKQALGVLNRLVSLPRTTRMPSIAIYGDSGMGKTMLMESFCSDHPARFDPEAGVERTPVLALQMAGKPGERRLYVQLLAALGLPPPGSRASVVDLEQTALRLMRAIGVQVLVIDEVHNILAGSQREQRVVLNTLRYLSNELKRSLVCFGVAEAREAISGDVQLARRLDDVLAPALIGGRRVRGACRVHPTRLVPHLGGSPAHGAVSACRRHGRRPVSVHCRTCSRTSGPRR